MIPALSLAGRTLGVERRRARTGEDKKSAVAVVNNICPTDYADALTQEGDVVAIERMRFGLVPRWAKGCKAEVSKKFSHTFNARCESVFELASYRGPILRQRCLIPVRGWHEWPDRMTPYFIHRDDDAPLLLAGIWDVWQSQDPVDEASGPVVTSMSVITTPPGSYMGKFHDRCPLILEGEAAGAWIQPGMQADDLRQLIKPYESEHLEAYRVSTLANQARNKTEAVFAPIAPPVPQEGEDPAPTGDDENNELPGL